MPTSEWPTAPSVQVQQFTEQTIAQAHELELLREGFADLALAAGDKHWLRLGAAAEDAFDRRGIGQIPFTCRVMTIASPLLKRGKQLRAGYVWGQGVEVQARASADAEQDVNAVIQAFWDDESNQNAFTSSLAQEENEGVLYSDGNVFIAGFTNPLTGRVQVRSTPPSPSPRATGSTSGVWAARPSTRSATATPPPAGRGTATSSGPRSRPLRSSAAAPTTSCATHW